MPASQQLIDQTLDAEHHGLDQGRIIADSLHPGDFLQALLDPGLAPALMQIKKERSVWALAFCKLSLGVRLVPV
jgi:hypothetical protein